MVHDMSTILAELDYEETARRLGYDLFVFGRLPIENSWPTAVQEGYEQAQGRFLNRQSSNRFVRKWLQLRMNALARNRIFDERITPDVIQAIDVDQCPVLRTRLTHGENSPTDWSVDRINNDGGYALHNLVVISVFANQAKGARRYEEVYALSQLAVDTDGLTPVEWLRVACIMHGPCFVEKGDNAPFIPLACPIPLFTARAPDQILQQLFMLLSKTSKGRNTLIKNYKNIVRNPDAKEQLAYVVDLLHIYGKQVEYPCDVWLNEKIQSAFKKWANIIGPRGLQHAAVVAQRHAPVRQHAVSDVGIWNLHSGGYRTT